MAKKKRVIIQSLPIFYQEDLCNEGDGFSLYKGILIQWDKDYDERILGFIDRLSEETRYCLLVVHENEGCLYLLWNEDIPDGYEEGKELNVCDDRWFISESKAIE